MEDLYENEDPLVSAEVKPNDGTSAMDSKNIHAEGGVGLKKVNLKKIQSLFKGEKKHKKGGWG